MQAEALKRIVVGRPMASGQIEDTLLSKFLALPVFASDPLSSVAYATEAAIVVLVAVSATRAHLVLPISVAIAALLAIVVVSYTADGPRVRDERRRVRRRQGQPRHAAEPRRRGGAARWTTSSPSRSRSPPGSSRSRRRRRRLHPYRVWLSLACVVAARRSRTCAASASPAPLRAADVRLRPRAVRDVGDRHREVRRRHVPAGDRRRIPSPPERARSTLLVLLRAFASGIGRADRRRVDLERRQRVQAPAVARTRRRRSRCMAAIAITLFLGVSWLAVKMHARPSETVSVLSQIAHASFPTGADVLRRPGLHARDPDPRGEHVVPGLPAARRAARARPLLPAAVREPRRPARLLERDHPRRRARGGADRRSSRRTSTRCCTSTSSACSPRSRSRRPGWCATGAARATAAGSGARSSTASARARPAS